MLMACVTLIKAVAAINAKSENDPVDLLNFIFFFYNLNISNQMSLS
jgi:hypothetical protein